MSNVPLPERSYLGDEAMYGYDAEDMSTYAAAVSAADNAALRKENFALAAGQCVSATADDGGRLYCKEVIALRERVRVLEDALWETYRLIGRGGDAYDISKRTTPVFRAALGDKT